MNRLALWMLVLAATAAAGCGEDVRRLMILAPTVSHPIVIGKTLDGRSSMIFGGPDGAERRVLRSDDNLSLIGISASGRTAAVIKRKPRTDTGTLLFYDPSMHTVATVDGVGWFRQAWVTDAHETVFYEVRPNIAGPFYIWPVPPSGVPAIPPKDTFGAVDGLYIDKAGAKHPFGLASPPYETRVLPDGGFAVLQQANVDDLAGGSSDYVLTRFTPEARRAWEVLIRTELGLLDDKLIRDESRMWAWFYKNVAFAAGDDPGPETDVAVDIPVGTLRFRANGAYTFVPRKAASTARPKNLSVIARMTAAFYEQAYLQPAAAQLAQAAGLSDAERGAAEKALRDFIHDFEDTWAKAGGAMTAADHAACLDRLDQAMTGVLAPEKIKKYRAWRTTTDIGSQPLGFLLAAPAADRARPAFWVTRLVPRTP
jgi:hypothetical protein